MRSNAWIGVDLDSTLAHYDTWRTDGSVGEPIWPMVERVKNWLSEGKRVKIFTARVSYHPLQRHTREEMIEIIQDWCEEHIGERLEVTNEKDYLMAELWDDRAVQVEPNVGEPTTYWVSRVS